MPAFAPVDSPESLSEDDGDDKAAAAPDIAALADDATEEAAAEDATLEDVEKSVKSLCWYAIVSGCAHIVTWPRLAPSSVDVTMRLFGSRVPSGRARTPGTTRAVEYPSGQ